MSEWKVGKVGRVEGWKVGRLEGWKGGRFGRVEGWEVGRLEGLEGLKVGWRGRVGGGFETYGMFCALCF